MLFLGTDHPPSPQSWNQKAQRSEIRTVCILDSWDHSGSDFRHFSEMSEIQTHKNLDFRQVQILDVWISDIHCTDGLESKFVDDSIPGPSSPKLSWHI